MIDLAPLYRFAKFQLNRTFGSWDIDILILKLMTSWGHAHFWWRQKIRPMIDLATLYRFAKFQLNRTFGSWDIDIHILELMTSSGHAHFWWRHKTWSVDRPCHPISACKVSTKLGLWFLRYWHSYFEVDDVIRPCPLLVTSHCFVFWLHLPP